jgi:hypothetical protein
MLGADAIFMTHPGSISYLEVLVTYACDFQVRYQNFWPVLAPIKSDRGKYVESN